MPGVFVGSPIAFIDGARNLCLSEADGSGLRRLAEARWDERGHNLLGHYWPTWAPDGRRLAFSSLAVEGKSQLSATTYVVESQGGSPVALYRSPAGVPPVIA
ncbi:MAG: PD40 domain-containing protein, partial [Chloroflexi bacterium]|nr:PD40 domain-containing protein [Chloroflexota bacterium]